MYSIFNTPAGIGGKLGAFTVIEAGNGFDEADGANGNQILLILIGRVVFFDDMGNEPQVMFNELGFGSRVAGFDADQAVQLFLLGKRLREGADSADVKGKKDHVGQSEEQQGGSHEDHPFIVK